MIIWALIIFFLSLVLFLLYLFNMFTSFAPWTWSIILFIIALGMLIRIRSKAMEGEKEKLSRMVSELEERLKQKKS
jgi:membrane protein implicated in regulation of membrane protease activity